MRYAVLDWDNTLRNGYTLFSWIEFLLSKSVISSEDYNDIYKYDDFYRKKLISHDKYAQLACERYCHAVAGMDQEYFNCLLKEYFPMDNIKMYSFIGYLFEFFKEYDVKPIIISGAPSSIIEMYSHSLDIYEIYAFKEASCDGILSGNVAENYGFNKIRIIKQLKKRFGNNPIFAFGDSGSDIPLFEAAQYSFCVYNDKIDVTIKSDKRIPCNISSIELKSILESIVI